MKKLFLSIIIITIAGLNALRGQTIPPKIQQRLQEAKEDIRLFLDEFRTNRSDKYPDIYGLFSIFTHDERVLIDSLDLVLDLEIVYDDQMRDRLVQLLRNEYREDELDTLVERFINENLGYYETQAMEICRIDTLSLFRITITHLYDSLEAQNTLDLFKKRNRIYNYEVFKFLQLDTMEAFKQVFNKIAEKDRKEARASYLANTNDNYTFFVELCGRINDKRFVKPLIEALAKPDNFNREKVIEALVRMEVEPYYSDYVKKRTRTIEQIKSEEPNFDIEELVEVLRTQESFLELSKYLLSDIPHTYISSDDENYVGSTMYNKAFSLIKFNLENADLQEMLKGKYSKDNPELRMPLYNWMQKNYGKYEIRRIW